MNKDDLLELPCTWETPTVRDIYFDKDFVIVDIDGTVLNFNTDTFNPFSTMKDFDEYESLEEFIARVGLTNKEFTQMYDENTKLKNAFSKVKPTIETVYTADL